MCSLRDYAPSIQFGAMFKLATFLPRVLERVLSGLLLNRTPQRQFTMSREPLLEKAQQLINDEHKRAKEAADCIQRAKDNMFPNKDLDTYRFIQTRPYYMVHFLVCILLLLLALAETPSVWQSELGNKQMKILITIHAVAEILLLTFLNMDAMVQFRAKIFKKRLIVLNLILIVMYLEALMVIVRQQNHIRITRILRPLFLLETYYMCEVRRVGNRILQILIPILEVILLLIFFIFLFALFGFLFFADTDPDYFNNYATSILSLFIAASTSNNPDVMMESYAQHGTTPIFFVVYLLVTYYFIVDVLLATMYSSFSEAYKKKFKKLFFFRRSELHQAFNKLKRPDKEEVEFHDFLLMMQYYSPRMPEWNVFCIFKALNKKPRKQYQALDKEHFEDLLDVIDFKWKQKKVPLSKCQKFRRCIKILVSCGMYKLAVGLVSIGNFLLLVVVAWKTQDSTERFEKFQKLLPGTFIFLIIYSVDILLNAIGKTPCKYFSKIWNWVDAVIVVASLVCAVADIYHFILAVLLPLKLIRVIRLKRRYRDIMSTITALTTHVFRVIILMLLIYYCYAIIGMEFFYKKVEQGCCESASFGVGDYFKDSTLLINDTTPSENVYYLNNFDNLLRSYSTLFVLMVVNNWYIIMEGFASEVPHNTVWLTRIYFMSFYLITLVVLQVILAFIVDAFQVKIESATIGKEEKVVTLEVSELETEVKLLDKQTKGVIACINKKIRECRRKEFKDQEKVTFKGLRKRTKKEDIHQLLYKEEIKKWKKMGYNDEYNATIPEQFRNFVFFNLNDFMNDFIDTFV